MTSVPADNKRIAFLVIYIVSIGVYEYLPITKKEKRIAFAAAYTFARPQDFCGPGRYL